MKSLIGLFAFTFSMAAQAGEFRCFGDYTAQGNADVLLYGDTDKSASDDLKFEFIADNGFYGSGDYKVKTLDFADAKRLNLTARAKGHPNLKLETKYNANVGDYRGVVATTANGKTESLDIRCVVLKGI